VNTPTGSTTPQLGYEEAIDALGDSPLVTEISDQYERLLDTWIDDPGAPAPSWQDYFTTVLHERRSLGLLTGDDAHLNTNTALDPATGLPYRTACDSASDSRESRDCRESREDVDDEAADEVAEL
jgi:hypothetical protein